MFKVILFFTFLPLLVLPCNAQSDSDVALFPVEVRGKTDYINIEGSVVIKPKFDDGWSFSQGFAPVLVGDKWGYIDKSGKIIIEPQFSEAGNFRNGVAKVNTSGKFGNIELHYWEKWAYINKSGKFIWKSS